MPQAHLVGHFPDTAAGFLNVSQVGDMCRQSINGSTQLSEWGNRWAPRPVSQQSAGSFLPQTLSRRSTCRHLLVSLIPTGRGCPETPAHKPLPTSRHGLRPHVGHSSRPGTRTEPTGCSHSMGTSGVPSLGRLRARHTWPHLTVRHSRLLLWPELGSCPASSSAPGSVLIHFDEALMQADS